jgi:uncharacterized membrane protein YedE/YeeE
MSRLVNILSGSDRSILKWGRAYGIGLVACSIAIVTAAMSMYILGRPMVDYIMSESQRHVAESRKQSRLHGVTHTTRVLEERMLSTADNEEKELYRTYRWALAGALGVLIIGVQTLRIRDLLSQAKDVSTQ